MRKKMEAEERKGRRRRDDLQFFEGHLMGDERGLKNRCFEVVTMIDLLWER